MVVKKDGVREPFDREKVLRGVRLACNKRPVAMVRIERFIDELERELIEGEAKEVASKEIGERVMPTTLTVIRRRCGEVRCSQR